VRLFARQPEPGSEYFSDPVGESVSSPPPGTSAATRGELPRRLIRAVWRDPYHFAEHLVLIAQEQLGDATIAWAAGARACNPDASPEQLAHELRSSAVGFARTNGALAGTPSLIALVPAYMSVLWEQARMTMKIAALNGRDPREATVTAEILYLRGVYETPDAAAQALSRLDATPTRSESTLGSKVRSWIQLICVILVLAGVLWTPADHMRDGRDRSRRALVISYGFAAVWFLVTSFIPITCMIDMAYSCASDTRTLATRAINYYAHGSTVGQRGGSSARTGRSRRPGGHRSLLIVSLAIPFGLISLAVLDPVHHARLAAISGFLGLGVVFALWAAAARV